MYRFFQFDSEQGLASAFSIWDRKLMLSSSKYEQRERERERETDRQTDRQTHTHTHTHTHTEGQRQRERCGETEIEIYTQKRRYNLHTMPVFGLNEATVYTFPTL